VNDRPRACRNHYPALPFRPSPAFSYSCKLPRSSPRKTSSLFSIFCKCSLLQLLSFEILTNARGRRGFSPPSDFQTSQRSNVQRFKSFSVTSLAAPPHLLTPIESHPYKNHSGEGVHCIHAALFCPFLHQECFTTSLQSNGSTLFLRIAGVSPNNSHFGPARLPRICRAHGTAVTDHDSPVTPHHVLAGGALPGVN
jgi:hypothetical protein